MYGIKGRIGVIVPANNSVLEPEFWSRLPNGMALYATRLLAKGDLTPEAVRRMEGQVDLAVEQLAATGLDVLLYADMVTTFIMEAGWNETKTAQIVEHTSVPCVSAWTALRDALATCRVERFALGTPYPAAIHAQAAHFFVNKGFAISDDSTLDIRAMREVPQVAPERLERFVMSLNRAKADAVVLLATDLPTFRSIERLEQDMGIPILTSNQTLLWRALRTVGWRDLIPNIGRVGRLTPQSA